MSSVGSLSAAQLMYMIDIRVNTMTDVVLKTLDTRLGAIEKRLRGVTNASRQATSGLAALQKQMLMLGLSTMFFGMQLYMIGRNITRSLVTAFVNARAEGDYFVNRLLAVNAAFEFMKFAIVDAFAQTELFEILTTKFIEFMNAISGFIAKHPQLAAFIMLFLGIAIAVGGVLFVFGSLAMGINAIITLVTTLAGWFTALKVAGLGAALAATLGWIAVAAAIVIALFAIYALVRYWKELWTLFIVAFKDIGLGFQALWDLAVTNAKMAFLLIGYHWNNLVANMQDAFESMINKLVTHINKLIGVYNRLKPAWAGAISELDFMEGASDKRRGMQSDIHDKMLGLSSDYSARADARNVERFQNDQRGENAVASMKEKWDSDNDFLKGIFGMQTKAQSDLDSHAQESSEIVVQEVNIVVSNPMNGDQVIDELEDYFKNAEKRLLGTPNSG